MAQYRTQQPSTGTDARTWEPFIKADVTYAINAADNAFTLPRATKLGGPTKQGIGEARLCNQVVAYYAERAPGNTHQHPARLNALGRHSDRKRIALFAFQPAPVDRDLAATRGPQ